MDELIARIRAALDEAERIARAALDESRWDAMNAHGFHMEDPFVGYRDDSGTVATGMRPDQAIHIAHNDPAAVLRRVAADRKLLHEILRYEAKLDSELSCCHDAEAIGRGECPYSKPNEIPALLALAEGYGIEES